MCAFNTKTLFSAAVRKKCMSKLNSVHIPAAKQIPPTAKATAVFMPICDINEQACLFYTVRTATAEKPYDTGRVTFPGGYCAGNEPAVKAALRETQDDTGLDTKQVEVWGVGPTVPGRNYNHLIKPVVGSVLNCNPKNFKLNSKKVTEAFTVPLELLCDPKTQFYTQFKNGFILPVFVVEKYKIWGMTAFLTHALLSSLLPKEIYNNEWKKKKITLRNIA